jgi:hypothetical protein
MNVNISVNAIWIIAFDMKQTKMFLLKWNVIIGVKGYSEFKPKISNHLEVGKNWKTLKNLTKTPLNAFSPNR